jgi:DNA-binding transcriptional ArsR family regulator
VLSETFKALGDPTRREILRRLNEGDLAAGEIAAAFDISAPSVSHHLSVLKKAGLVTSSREGQSIVYTLNSTVVQEFIQELLEFFKVGETSDA